MYGVVILALFFVTSSAHRASPPYETLGCFQDHAARAIPSLEGQDSILDGNYGNRKNAIEKCYHAAKRRGFRMFAIQNGGWCASSATAVSTFNKYGGSSACKSDGEGGPWANQVYYINELPYETLGCFQDHAARAIPPIERQDAILDGNYGNRKNAIEKCYHAAKRRGFRMFAIQNGGWCASSATATSTFNKYGGSSACKSDGEGGPWANQVYYIKELPYETLGCFQDHSARAIPPLEGQDSILDGRYVNRKNAIEKCYHAAKKRGFRMFAIQNGGWCASSATAVSTFNKYGGSSACRSDGEGGPWGNQVYYIKAE